MSIFWKLSGWDQHSTVCTSFVMSNDRFGSVAVILPQTRRLAASGQKQPFERGKFGSELGVNWFKIDHRFLTPTYH